MSLTSIPSCILDAILEQCSCRDLALLACASKALDDVVGTSQVWEHACLSKWPQCNVDWYDGNWKALYGKRMQQPSSLPGLVDSAVSLVQQGHAAFQPYLNRLLALGLLYHAWPQATKHVEHKQLAESVRFWMEEQPQVALAAVKVVYDQLLTFNPAAHMEAACMRSAMHFMMEGTLACGHPSFLGRLERELAQLDMLLKKCQQSAGTLSLRVQQLDVRCETKTKDNVFITLVVSVQYQVQKEALWDAFYRLTDSKQQISSYIFDVVRATVPKMILDDVFVEKEEIAKDIKEELTKSMSTYGFLIIHALVNDIEPAQKVRDAMNEINAARRLRVAALEKAEAEKVAVVKAAEANAEAKYLQGQGMARQRQAITTGMRDSMKEFDSTPGITSKDVIELMLMTQYFDTMKELGASNKSSTIFLPHAPGAVSDMSYQLRNAFLEGAAGSAAHTKEKTG